MSATTAPQARWNRDQPAFAVIAEDKVDDLLLPESLHLVAMGNITASLSRKVWQGDSSMLVCNSNQQQEWFQLPAQLPSIRQPGLLLMDMDSTAIEMECIDEIARRGGVYEQVSAVTEQAMQGQLDFADALRVRVALLAGIPASVLAEIAADLPLMPGLKVLCRSLQQHGWKIAIASGGFNAIAAVLAQQLQADYFEANELEQHQGILTGKVTGAIVDAQRKAEILAELGARFEIEPSQWVAIGDGANDLPMLATANLGVGFRAKPKVAAQADVAINYLGLDAVLGLLTD
ncbi:phosphoserine phosphatase SerB [Ferrimonas lipolytica]|uniref:Phosphoserine phosphatase n=1 Tax=Ferrimonas lipolytica TaxID=2724191 RepID=A0A6H1UA85_9GAMM|nr:phosphoserine phosphatase SerB [Ferrimonas lipolytica]QIZ75944.1 phosphoserine phosphatase SerB [Ferrimonas lipolytica]